MIEAVARIVRAVKVPVTADIEHAYAATPDAVAEVVLRVIAAGAVGINVEDYVPGADDLEPLTLQVDKITAIIKAATKAGVRSSSTRAPTSFCASSARPRRGLASPSSAARRIWPPAPTACSSPACAIGRPSARSSAASAAPSTCWPSTGTPPIAELEALGVARVSLGSGPMLAALAVVRDVARELMATRHLRGVHRSRDAVRRGQRADEMSLGLGFRVKSGYAIAVALRGPASAPERRRAARRRAERP